MIYCANHIQVELLVNSLKYKVTFPPKHVSAAVVAQHFCEYYKDNLQMMTEDLATSCVPPVTQYVEKMLIPA